MASKVEIRVYCDVHLKNGESVPANYGEVIAFGGLARQIDLCDEHREKLIGDLPDLLKQYGTMPEGQNRLPMDPTADRRRSPQQRRRRNLDNQQQCLDCAEGPFTRVDTHYRIVHKLNPEQIAERKARWAAQQEHV